VSGTPSQPGLVGTHVRTDPNSRESSEREESETVLSPCVHGVVQKADGLLSMLEDANKSDDTRKFKRKKRKKLVKSTNNTVSRRRG